MSQKRFEDVELKVLNGTDQAIYWIHKDPNKPFYISQCTGDYYDSGDGFSEKEMKKLYLHLKEYFEQPTTKLQEQAGENNLG